MQRSGYVTVDYNACGTTDFRSGVYEVGSGGAGTKAIDLPDGSITLLSDIFTAAKRANVKRIHWLCCTCLEP